MAKKRQPKQVKLKTKKILSKRVNVTASGKIERRHVRTSHLKEKQSANTKRRKSRDETLSATDNKRIRKMLPYK